MKDAYWNGRKCVDKPPGVKRDEAGTTLESMKLTKGFFRFTATSTEVYPCPYYFNCKGGKITGNSTSCREGSGGPLCSVCQAQHYMSEDEGCLEVCACACGCRCVSTCASTRVCVSVYAYTRTSVCMCMCVRVRCLLTTQLPQCSVVEKAWLGPILATLALMAAAALAFHFRKQGQVFYLTHQDRFEKMLLRFDIVFETIQIILVLHRGIY